MLCHVCGSPTVYFGCARVLRKYEVDYFRCTHCGFIQTDEPFWLAEAYTDTITRSDVGMVQRNVELAHRTQAVLLALYDPNRTFLDYGGGYGLLVRLMRDAGFNFLLHDPHCENLFAQTAAVPSLQERTFELITAFEVLEHLVRPLGELQALRRVTEHFLVSTQLLPDPPPPLGSWWYYGLEHGQHVSLFSRGALQHLAQALNLTLYSDGRSLHLLSSRRFPPRLFRWIVRRPFTTLVRVLLSRRLKNRSLLPVDYEQVAQQRLQ